MSKLLLSCNAALITANTSSFRQGYHDHDVHIHNEHNTYNYDNDVTNIHHDAGGVDQPQPGEEGSACEKLLQ